MRLIDNDGFVTMIKKYKRIIYKVINTYCNDVDDKKDLEQEILIQLWKSYQSYNGSTQLSTWIYRIAMNVSISFYRNNVTRKTNTTSINQSIFQELASSATNEKETDQRRLLYGFISQLDEFNREVFMLYLDDYSHKEIAEIVGITESNVGTKINRIKHKIHEYFLTLNKKS